MHEIFRAALSEPTAAFALTPGHFEGPFIISNTLALERFMWFMVPLMHPYVAFDAKLDWLAQTNAHHRFSYIVDALEAIICMIKANMDGGQLSQRPCPLPGVCYRCLSVPSMVGLIHHLRLSHKLETALAAKLSKTAPWRRAVSHYIERVSIYLYFKRRVQPTASPSRTESACDSDHTELDT